MHIPEVMRDRRFWITTGVATALGAGAWALSHKTARTSAPELQTAPTVTPSVALGIGTFHINFDGKEWSCAKVNNPKQESSYNPDLPAIPNAFRAIELAGIPGSWETGPFLYRDIKGRLRVVDNWNDLSLTYNGDAACVTGH